MLLRVTMAKSAPGLITASIVIVATARISIIFSPIKEYRHKKALLVQRLA
jgi:hypothetical protein